MTFHQIYCWNLAVYSSKVYLKGGQVSIFFTAKTGGKPNIDKQTIMMCAFPSLGSHGKTHRIKQHRVDSGVFFQGFLLKKHKVLSHYPGESI